MYTGTRRWAWFPQRSDSGLLVWFDYYWIVPNSNGEGRVLTNLEYLREAQEQKR